MSYRLILTDTAKEDLREIALYIAQQFKETNTAKKLVNELRERCNILKEFPNSGSIPRDRVLRSAGYRFLVHKDYLIFYEVDEKSQTVYVMAIFNGRRDYMRVMRKFI